MTENDFSYITRIGNTTFIINIRQSKNEKSLYRFYSKITV